MDLEKFAQQAKNKKAENKKFLQGLKKENPRKLDDRFHEAHEEVFARIDCLACANCCKTTSPIFIPSDIDRLAKTLGMKPGQFIDAYLKVDEDQDYVLKSSPCTFLNEDNTCQVYEDRPRACREYPHTDRKKMYQLLDLTFKNTLVCPAVLEIVEQMKTS
ncbi:YkgJ family cysteine cluster protein [Cytophagales bacterium LB-30]|uniref:YkgJ family cysteine cluster protein n=1 Tax=Shiella aurantiaca TaxID=3058365 RepID=A0ABT8F7L2_9BACT|nr:YkgJ family cysteine cluster protein [Shiella aurantiaca]MDN4166278.1 YkgJ family cysteine cluster protein [Shiella aurantiaca]